VIISVGDRRMVSDRFGWKIEKSHVPKKGAHAGETVWAEDRPAYPATLTRGLELLLERILKEAPDTDIGGLVQTIRSARKELLDSISVVKELDI
jgi:hypothetical protein